MPLRQQVPLQQFKYEARDDTGLFLAGSLSAKDRSEAAELLNQRKLFVLNLSAQRFQRSMAAVPNAPKQQIAWQLWQLSTMVEAGIGLSEGLDCLARQATKPGLRALLADVAKQIREGRSLSQAMSEHPKSFGPSLIAMIRASELSGSLSKVLRQSSSYLIKDLEVLARARAALAYPAFMFILCLSVILFMLSFVLPKFAQVFASKGQTLPAPTRMLMAASDSFVGFWPYWVGGLFVALIFVGVWCRGVSGKRQIDTWMTSLPGIAPIFNALHQGRAFRTMATLLDAHVPLIDAIRVVQDVVPNSRYRELWTELEEHVRGGSVAPPLFASPFIDEAVAQIVDVGDRTGKLDVAFNHLATLLEERYNRSIAAATQMIEPAMMLIVGGIVAFVALSMMLPLFQAARVVSH